ncbi:MAG: DNA methyltransferase [Candidatus Bathyarchaeia archaeon]
MGETVLDPFLGSGTTTKVAKELGRNSVGYEIDLELKDIILKKINYNQTTLTSGSVDKVEIIERLDARRLRTFLQEKIKNQRSVVKKDVVKLVPAATTTANSGTKISKKNSGWEKLKRALPTVEAVEERLKHAREKNLSPSYIQTLERLKAHLEKKQEITPATE